MSFDLTQSQKAIVKSVQEFAKGEFDAAKIPAPDGNGSDIKSLRQKAADLGFIGIHLPENLSGGGMSMLEHALVAETLCAHDPTIGSAIMLSGVGVEWLAQYAGEGVQRTYLPGILEGRLLPGIAVQKTAPEFTLSGGASEKTICVNGEADYVINGGLADLYLLPTADGFLVLDARTSGVSVDKTHPTLGLKMTAFSKVRLRDAAIPAEQRVVVKKAGSSGLLPPIWLLLGAIALGIGRGSIDRAVAHVKKRVQFGRKLAAYQVLRHKLAGMETQLAQARWLTLSAAENLHNKRPDAKRAPMACIAAISAAVDISSEAIQLFGGYGYTSEYDVERFSRDAKTLQLISGGSRVLNDAIADGVIGAIR